MCDKEVEKDPWSLAEVPEHFKTQEMWNKAVNKDPYSLSEVPEYFKTQKMCNKAVEKDLYSLMSVPERFKTQEVEVIRINFRLLFFFLQENFTSIKSIKS